MASRISLCVITGNEQPHVLRFLDAFAPAFDELCIVRAVGATPHDQTLTTAKDWCRRNAKECRIGEYLNAGAAPLTGAGIDEGDPRTWPHVDDFAAARNQAWAMATGDWQFWADLDDVIAPEDAAKIRATADSGAAEYYFFRYAIAASGESNIRERLFRRGDARWNQPVHETCRVRDESKKYLVLGDVVFSHEPQPAKVRDPHRNRRIMQYHLRHLNAFAVELHREYFYEWQHKGQDAAAEKATKWAEIAQTVDTMAEQRFDTLLRMSEIAREKDIDHALDLCWSAARIAPWMREPWGCMAELELRANRPTRAEFFSGLMQSLKKPHDTGFPMLNRFYSWEGLHLRTRTLRAAGKGEEARRQEDRVFQANGARISLIHATRGRPEKARETRALWFKGAINPLGVEHIFAVDADDAASIEALAHYRRVIVPDPNGCVKAWNAAAADSTGRILIQLSDDWVPCLHWDELIWLALDEAAQKRGGTLDDTPLVLAINDGKRKDALLCMAIMTRARWEAQGREMFSGDYFGVFSDNEFTWRAHRDAVVVQAQHIQFAHQHPVFEGKPFEQWDETHRRQNDSARYREGRDIFLRRNPDAAQAQQDTDHAKTS